jgi:hypothetical protein
MRPELPEVGLVAVVFNVGLRAQDVRDLFFGTRREVLVVLQLGNARLIRGGNVLRGMVLTVG